MSQAEVSPPPANDRSNLSLLSLSIAAANAAPITAPPVVESTVRPLQAPGTSKHRRLSSTGRARRRLSDARDAATRPSPASLQTVASMAALSLSSPTMANASVTTNGTRQLFPVSAADDDLDDKEVSTSLPTVQGVSSGSTGSVTRSGRKRGTTFTCESCSKVYRHPSCLIKHRWEHTPQWREASKFVLSKHQQVQLLEAAAILSHLSPSSASLPEDRSLWPSFLSGGLVPPPASESDVTALEGVSSPPGVPGTHPISSSVPATSISSTARPGSSGPRLHNYAIPLTSSGSGGIARLRPGLLGVPTPPPSSASPSIGGSSPLPVPVPAAPATHDDAHNLLALRSASVTSESWWSSPRSPLPSSASVYYDAASYPVVGRRQYQPYALVHVPVENEREREHEHEHGWSLPRSSVRSKSASSHSHSRSASESKSDDDDGEGEGELVDADVDEAVAGVRAHRLPRVYGASGARVGWKMEDVEDGVGIVGLSVREEDEYEEDGEGKAVKVVPAAADHEAWDGMEMEMEMD